MDEIRKVGTGHVGTVTSASAAARGHDVRRPDPTNTADSPEGDAPPPPPRRSHRRWIVPCCVTALYVLFVVAVHLRRLDDLDIAAGHAARPDGGWGPVQMRATHVVGALQPAHLAAALLLLVTGLSLLRRSLRPLGVMALVALPVVVVTLGTKRVMSHWDPAMTPVAHTSFPSGHMVSAVTAFGVAVVLLRPGTRWGWLLPAAAGGVTGGALVLASVHPATDVLGGGLLAAAALAGATAAGLGPWAKGSHGSRR